MVLSKHEIESALRSEHQEIAAGRLRDENPLDDSEDFELLCQGCRSGDLPLCHDMIAAGRVNINSRNDFDYTPLILASLCGHYEVVQLLLESGALCERDTFQGERCLYNALNDRIRNLLLSYDYSKTTDPLQPLVGHITSLLTREDPKTSDMTLLFGDESMQLHKFMLAARSPYFQQKLAMAPGTAFWRLPNSIPWESAMAVMKFIYFSEVSADFGEGEREQTILRGIEKLSRILDVDRFFDPMIVDCNDRRVNRQRRADEISRGQEELHQWFTSRVIENKIFVETASVEAVEWDRSNAVYADVILRADEDPADIGPQQSQATARTNAIPIGPSENDDYRRPRMSVLYPVHRAMLIRSEFFNTMFTSSFREAQHTERLQIVTIDCAPNVLEIVLSYLYTERCHIDLSSAIDVLFAADLLFIEKLKVKAATVISTLGHGNTRVVHAEDESREVNQIGPLDIYEVLRAGWITRSHRLEEFAARYIANHLEQYIDEEDFFDLVQESAARIKERQETDTIELIDDIRFYLSDRFRLRFEDAGLEEMMDDTESQPTQNEFIDASETAATAFDGKQGAESSLSAPSVPFLGVVRTLDGEDVDDQFGQDALQYQMLLGRIDTLLENLKLDA